MKHMATLVVEQQSKSENNRDFDLVELLESFKGLGFTQVSVG
jgi:hypothetical protein